MFQLIYGILYYKTFVWRTKNNLPIKNLYPLDNTMEKYFLYSLTTLFITNKLELSQREFEDNLIADIILQFKQFNKKTRYITSSCILLDWGFPGFSSTQLLSHVRLSETLWTAARQASLFITNSQSLLKLMSIESVMPSNHLILCRPLLLLPSIFPSIGVFSNESILHIKWPQYWSFSFSISPCNEHPGLISFRVDWLDLLAVQGTLKSLLQHHSSKALILGCSAFCIIQL